jgi:hypothetical protein
MLPSSALTSKKAALCAAQKTLKLKKLAFYILPVFCFIMYVSIFIVENVDIPYEFITNVTICVPSHLLFRQLFKALNC